jgi:hypothetical protein
MVRQQPGGVHARAAVTLLLTAILDAVAIAGGLMTIFAALRSLL